MAISDWRNKDWSKVVLTDEVKDYVADKYGTDWSYGEQKVDITLKDLWQNPTMNQRLRKLVLIVISSNDDDLLTDEEIVLMGDISFSTTDDDSDDDDSLRRYRKISMTGYVLFLRARDAPTPVDQYVRKLIKSQVKVTNCILPLRVVNAPYVDVESLSTRRKSRKHFVV
ncbi:hypothetical protein Tco_0769789 [Tanacetum coccineum]|uniref:Uncharacterized protein n=1 Tax=Tanacetum coccineum TaxID=301880 RepID=A0ABQ4ZE01_9ASTR